MNQVSRTILFNFFYLLFFLNQTLIRFADHQSLVIVVSLSALVEALTNPFKYFVLIGLIIISNPLPLLFQTGTLVLPKIFKPFDVEIILKPMRTFS